MIKNKKNIPEKVIVKSGIAGPVISEKGIILSAEIKKIEK